MKLLSPLNDAGRTVVLITHEEEIARFAGRVVRLRDGRIASDEVQSDRTEVRVRTRVVMPNSESRHEPSSAHRDHAPLSGRNGGLLRLDLSVFYCLCPLLTVDGGDLPMGTQD